MTSPRHRRFAATIAALTLVVAGYAAASAAQSITADNVDEVYACAMPDGQVKRLRWNRLPKCPDNGAAISWAASASTPTPTPPEPEQVGEFVISDLLIAKDSIEFGLAFVVDGRAVCFTADVGIGDNAAPVFVEPADQIACTTVHSYRIDGLQSGTWHIIDYVGGPTGEAQTATGEYRVFTIHGPPTP